MSLSGNPCASKIGLTLSHLSPAAYTVVVVATTTIHRVVMVLVILAAMLSSSSSGSLRARK